LENIASLSAQRSNQSIKIKLKERKIEVPASSLGKGNGHQTTTYKSYDQ